MSMWYLNLKFSFLKAWFDFLSHWLWSARYLAWNAALKENSSTYQINTGWECEAITAYEICMRYLYFTHEKLLTNLKLHEH